MAAKSKAKSKSKSKAKTRTTKKASGSKAAAKKSGSKSSSKKKAASKTAKKKSKKKTSKESKLFKRPSDVRLLVVDDEVEVLNLLVPYLRKRGYVVSEAEDGDQALEKILTERPNIVILDVMMPGLNGWEISQYVRDRRELDPVRIIMATGIGEEMNAATAPLYGADAYIDKPFRLDEVDKTVQEVLARIESGAL